MPTCTDQSLGMLVPRALPVVHDMYVCMLVSHGASISRDKAWHVYRRSCKALRAVPRGALVQAGEQDSLGRGGLTSRRHP